MPMAVLQFKFHSSRFVTDRHRLPNDDYGGGDGNDSGGNRCTKVFDERDKVSE